LAHAESNTRTTFILFVSTGLGMCDRLHLLVCNDRLPMATQAPGRLRHSGVIGKKLNTGWHI